MMNIGTIFICTLFLVCIFFFHLLDILVMKLLMVFSFIIRNIKDSVTQSDYNNITLFEWLTVKRQTVSSDLMMESRLERNSYVAWA